MRFLVDAQLPPALGQLLKAAGYECEHVSDVDLGGADDAPIWSYAAACGAILLTKDEDFASRRAARPDGRSACGLDPGR
jgi:predicted nuclease of predicted toxin-antitoxin system